MSEFPLLYPIQDKNVTLYISEEKYPKNANKRISSHVKIKNTVYETLYHPSHAELYTMQFYLGNPRSWKCRTIGVNEKQLIYDLCIPQQRTFYVHANHPVLVGYPKITSYKPHRYPKSREFVDSVLNSLCNLPGGLIIHIGKGEDTSIQNAIDFVNETSVVKGIGRVPRPFMLENAAGQNNEIGVTMEELHTIFSQIESPNVGFCLDTQHAFASGLCDFRSPAEIDQLFNDLDNYLPNRLSVIHLNDSKVPFGARVDRHENLCGGHIWKNDDTGLRHLLRIAYEREIDLILETNNCSEDRALLFSKYYDIL